MVIELGDAAFAVAPLQMSARTAAMATATPNRAPRGVFMSGPAFLDRDLEFDTLRQTGYK